MSMKPISWHRECLFNQMKTLDGVEAEFKRVQIRLENLRADTRYYIAQIDRAEREKRIAFDRERYDGNKK